jgi:hypothetical protein
MEIDRISRMGGVGQDGAPSWTRDKMHRRKFVEEVDRAGDESGADELNQQDEGEQEEAVERVELDEDHDGALDVVA